MAKGNSGGKRHGTSVSNSIRSEFLAEGLGSKFKGVVRDAKNGTGRFGYKNAKAVNENTAKKMNITRIHERNGKTLIEGFHKDKHVFYAEKNTHPTIKSLTAKHKESMHKKAKEQTSIHRPEIRTTTTYDRWLKNLQRETLRKAERNQ